MEKQHWLTNRFILFQDRSAIVFNNEQLTYADLLFSISDWLEVLNRHHIFKGEIIAICGDLTPQLCTLLIALFINGNIAVPITSFTPELREKYIQIAKVKYSIETTKNGSYFIHQHCMSTTPHSLVQKLQNQPGLILFSSEFTDKSKAIILNVNKLWEKHIKLRQGVNTLFFLLLEHIGGINTLLHVLTQGGTLIIPKNRELETICQTVHKHSIRLLPTTSTFLTHFILSETYKKYDLSSLQCITYGSELMPTSTLAALNNLFPTIQFKQSYGLPELGILPTKSERPDSLWFILDDRSIKYKIVEGILLIKTPSAMLGYLNALSPFDENGWFITGDRVETKTINGQEYLRIVGRRSEIINIEIEKCTLSINKSSYA